MTNLSPLHDIETLDRDGAIRESAEAAGLNPMTRRGAILTGGAAALTAGLAVLPAGAAAATRPGAALAAGDVKILKYALTLEYLEAAFYKEAVASGALSGSLLKFAKTTAAHEALHVATIKGVLGSKAGPAPSFDFKGTTQSAKKFGPTALALESTGVAAYLGQGANVKSNTLLGDAVAILAVESRHQAWIADILGKGGNPSPSPKAFATPHTMAQTLAIVKKTGFIPSL